MKKNSEDKTLLILIHILGIFTYFVGALIIFLTTENKKAKKHARNALNWQLSIIIYFGGLFLLGIFISIFKSLFSGFLFFAIPLPLLVSTLSILNIIFCILAAVKANENKFFEYPITMNLIKK
ncbi:MAG: DUF4870 domain-containing protein [Candidatus Pacearchaeota archaeon]